MLGCSWEDGKRTRKEPESVMLPFQSILRERPNGCSLVAIVGSMGFVNITPPGTVLTNVSIVP